MKITRPNNAEDNELNLKMNEILEHYLSKQGETIKEKEIYANSVIVLTESGRKFTTSVRRYIYLNEFVNGKPKRIKKEEW